MRSPEGKDAILHYVGVGAGISTKLKLPGEELAAINRKLARMERLTSIVPTLLPTILTKKINIDVVGAQSDFPSTGMILVNIDAGGDLQRWNFTGPCMYVEAGAGAFFKGGSATAMLFGLNPFYLSLALEGAALPGVSMIAANRCFSSARGAMLMAGLSVGQLGAGIAGYVGALV